MLGVAEPRNCRFPRAKVLDPLDRGFAPVLAFGHIHQIVQKDAGRFRAPEHDGTGAEKTRRHRALTASGAAANVIRAACTLGTSPCSASNQKCIHEETLIGVGILAHQQQEEIVREIDLADQFVAEVPSANCDRSRIGGGDCGKRCILLADAHERPPDLPLFRPGTTPDLNTKYRN